MRVDLRKRAVEVRARRVSNAVPEDAGEQPQLLARFLIFIGPMAKCGCFQYMMVASQADAFQMGEDIGHMPKTAQELA